MSWDLNKGSIPYIIIIIMIAFPGINLEVPMTFFLYKFGSIVVSFSPYDYNTLAMLVHVYCFVHCIERSVSHHCSCFRDCSLYWDNTTFNVSSSFQQLVAKGVFNSRNKYVFDLCLKSYAVRSHPTLLYLTKLIAVLLKYVLVKNILTSCVLIWHWFFSVGLLTIHKFTCNILII